MEAQEIHSKLRPKDYQLIKVIHKLRRLLEKTEKLEIVLDKGNGYWLKAKK